MSSDPDTVSGVGIEPGSDYVLSMRDVEVHFDQKTTNPIVDLFVDQDPVRAVDGVNLDIGENDVVALVGESGCGKTTLGKVAIGLQRPTAGSIKYRGTDVWDARNGNTDREFADIRQALQIIHQDPSSALNPNQKVRKSLSSVLKRWEDDLSSEDRAARIHNMLERVGVTPPEDYANRFPHQLSGGEQQRIVLIRALLMNPDLILADEAISALDVSLRVEMMDLLLEVQDMFNTSFLFISHDLSNARYLAEKADGRIAVMYLGRIVEIGPPEQIIHAPQHPYTQALSWATPSLGSDKSNESDLPVRSIDIPDPVDPPSGCNFHTRCPVARNVCTRIDPDLIASDGDSQEVACFRAEEDHEYWESPPLEGENR